MLRAYQRFADFNGRASRAEYWLFFVSQGLVSIGLSVFGIVLAQAGPFDILMLAIRLGVGVFMLIAGLSVTIRRLHDSNRSGWWLLLSLPVYLCVAMGLVYLVILGSSYFGNAGAGWAALNALQNSPFMRMFAQIEYLLAIAAALCALALLVMMCSKGTDGPNRFGADPLDPNAASPAWALDGAFDGTFVSGGDQIPDFDAADYAPAQSAPAPLQAPPPPVRPQNSTPTRPTFGRRGL